VNTGILTRRYLFRYFLPLKKNWKKQCGILYLIYFLHLIRIRTHFFCNILSASISNMVRGAQYDNGIPQSDNAIEAGETKAHGVNEGVCLIRFFCSFIFITYVTGKMLMLANFLHTYNSHGL